VPLRFISSIAARSPLCIFLESRSSRAYMQRLPIGRTSPNATRNP
jgi:hypothetical protein